ncbi:FadR/GntR family transcriptional regulator [Blastomonas sp.]|uniref:FadR/GntR family transcriptional regulator n=1 Tax=Blastomonas sp. TaxID=1909299 RepID=UPI002618F013|nr:FadR/GntR family transcriptional regulator [Blastomonas sp.]MDM7957542.1 FadR/GntR family transcriptional regulator [Blastomonas sp.]
MSEKRLFHSVAAQIGELIDEGTFPPGTRLPGERELAERFGVSRVTIREAEIALQAIGRIEIKTGSGVYVCPEQPRSSGILPGVGAFEVTEARLLIESEGAALAAKTISDADLGQLEGLLNQMASRDEAISTKADQEFHATIARASGNAAMVHVIETLWRMREELPEVKHMYESVCDADANIRAREHQDILDALKARDPARARDAMRSHFRRLIGAMLDVSEKRALEEMEQRITESRERFLSSAS